MFEDELNRLFEALEKRHKNRGDLRIVVYPDLSGHVEYGITELDDFENLVDYAGMIADPQWELKQRLSRLDEQVAVLRSEIAQIHRELGKDDDDIPF